MKAKVQVTKILGDHVAQARVLGEPSFRNPLVQGDKLYSPFWAPGYVYPGYPHYGTP